MLRYDAFADAGGRLSFSAALLDDEGDGLVVSTITGRSGDSRTYAKGLLDGRSDQAMSPEEDAVVAAARTQARAPRKPARGRSAERARPFARA